MQRLLGCKQCAKFANLYGKYRCGYWQTVAGIKGKFCLFFIAINKIEIFVLTGFIKDLAIVDAPVINDLLRLIILYAYIIMNTIKRKSKRSRTRKIHGGSHKYLDDESIINNTKNEYINKYFKIIKKAYDNAMKYDILYRNNYRAKTWIPSAFRKDNIENKIQISFYDLMAIFENRNTRIVRIVPNEIGQKVENLKQYLLEKPFIPYYYNRLAAAYMISNNIRDFYNKTSDLRDEYFNHIKTIILPKFIDVQIVNFDANNENHHFIHIDNSLLYFDVTLFEKYYKRKLQIKFNFEVSIMSDLLFMHNILYLKGNPGLLSSDFINIPLFDLDGRKNYEVNDNTKLISVLDKTAPNVLDYDTVTMINNMTAK